MREITSEAILTPLQVIDSLFATDFEAASSQAVANLVKSHTESYSTIPWLIPETARFVKHNQLVRIRGMVQDMPGTEPYAERFKTVAEGQSAWRFGRFRDRVEVGESDTAEAVIDDEQTVLNDRHVLIVTCAMPAQSELLRSETIQYASRQWEKLRDESTAGQTENDPKHLSTIVVKCYEEISARLNDVFDFVGVLSLDSFVPPQTQPAETTPVQNLEIDLPWYYREPVLTLHAISAEKLTKSREALRPFVIPEDVPYKFSPEVRERLMDCLTCVLSGDRLAAEFLLCHLISSVYGRTGPMVLGNLSINLCCTNEAIVQETCKFFQRILPHIEFIRISISELNNPPKDGSLDFLPKFVPAETRLQRGRLQLPRGSQIVIDETTLEAGKLEENGVKVLTALEDIAQFQRMYYDFVFYQKEFDAEYNVCVFSDFKSLVKCSIAVPLVASPQPPIAPKCEPVDFYQMAVLLAGARDTVGDFELPAPMQEVIANDFATIRKEVGGNSFTADDLSSMIVLARWLTISYGSRELTQEIWTKAKEMERERRARLTAFSSSKRPPAERAN